MDTNAKCKAFKNANKRDLFLFFSELDYVHEVKTWEDHWMVVIQKYLLEEIPWARGWGNVATKTKISTENMWSFSARDFQKLSGEGRDSQRGGQVRRGYSNDRKIWVLACWCAKVQRKILVDHCAGPVSHVNNQKLSINQGVVPRVQKYFKRLTLKHSKRNK